MTRLVCDHQRYGGTREAQDAYALQSQQRTAAAQERGVFKEEIVALAGIQPGRDEQVTLDLDEGNRPSTTREGLAGLPAVLPDRDGHRATVSAGNASQLSDGAAALVLMEAGEAARRGLEPLGTYRGIAVVGCEPDEMGIGPVFAVPRLLERTRNPGPVVGKLHRNGNRHHVPDVVAVLRDRPVGRELPAPCRVEDGHK